MGHHLLLTIRLHSDAQGTARYHGAANGAPEWPPAPARVFQAIVSGSARGNVLPDSLVRAMEWLERLPPPVIAAPRARPGVHVSLFVPNNDADSVDDPRDVSRIRTAKSVQPMLLQDSDVPFLYSWPIASLEPEATAILEAANDLYQLGRGVDMAWAVGELLDEGALAQRLREHRGTVHLPEPHASGRALACPLPGSLASLLQRHRTTKLRLEGKGRSAQFLFTNAPKPRFQSVTYERIARRVVFDLRDSEAEAKAWAWPIQNVVHLIESVRDRAAERLRTSLPDEDSAIERALIGRKADGSDSLPTEQRVRIVPLPSIGHVHVDCDIRRVLVEIPTGGPLHAGDIEWAFAGLELVDAKTGVVGPLLTRTDSSDMLQRYLGPTRRWRSVTAVALPQSAARRRIEPSRRRDEAKGAAERTSEQDRALASLHTALRHAGIRETVIAARLQREPFDAKGVRVENFAPATRFAKERLWHVELEFERPVHGPLVVGDGRFLGLGVMAPISEAWNRKQLETEHQHRPSPAIPPSSRRFGIVALGTSGSRNADAVGLARALRRMTMARVQEKLGSSSLKRFFTGHEENGNVARTEHASHLAFHWDGQRQRLLIVAPHWLDRREPTWQERPDIETLDGAMDDLAELRAGSAGRLQIWRQPIDEADPLLARSFSWVSVTPYLVTRHKRNSSAREVLIDDIEREIRKNGLPPATITVLAARGSPGRGLEGSLRLQFSVAVRGPIFLGRSRYLGGGMFLPSVSDLPTK